MHRLALRATLIAAALPVLLAAQTSPAPTGHRIALRYARFDPLESTPAVPAALRSGPDDHLWIVQYDAPMDDGSRKAILAAGAERIGFLPELAYLVRGDAKAVQQLRDARDVRWVGPYHPAYRLEPALIAEIVGQVDAPARRYHVVVADKHTDKPALGAAIRAIGGTVVHEQPGSILFDVELTRPQLAKAAHLDQVLWIDRWTAPEEDMNNARIQGGANYIESVGGYTGQGVHGHVYEGIDATSPDFNLMPINVLSGGGPDSHGHATSTIIFGNGYSNPLARGMAPDAQAYYTNYSTVTAGYSRWQVVQQLVTNYGVTFTTASWGDARTRSYTSISADADDIIFDNDIPWTQSQSNAGNQDSRPQAWAKNIFSIGGVEHFDNADRFDDSWAAGGASTGPAADGRIKPDLCAYYDSILTAALGGGTLNFSGTSGATPIVAGHNALAIQMFTDGLFGPVRNPGGSRSSNRPHFTTLKALMIANAMQYAFDAGSTDNRRVYQGWGFPDLRTMYDNRQRMLVVDETDLVTQGQTRSYTVTVQPGDPELKVALTWADPAANPAASTTRINDLSLRVTAPDGTVRWGNQGLLDGNYSTTGGSADTRDTVECVFVREPSPGNWTVDVLATLIAADSHVETPAVDADFGLCATFGTTVGRILRFGDGCEGSVTLPGCESLNGAGGSLSAASSQNEYAYDATATQNLTVQGFELFTASRTGATTSVLTALYLDNGSGQPAPNPVAVSTMTVSATPQFYSTTFPSTVSIPAGQHFWIAADSIGAYPSTLASGELGGAYYRATPRSGTTWYRSGVVLRASWRVMCQGGMGTTLIPDYRVTGAPTPGRTLSGALTKALPNATAVRLTGFSDSVWNGVMLPADLSFLGATGCTLLASGEYVEPLTTNANGIANATLAIPNSSALLGGIAFQQCAVLDAQSNAFGIAFTPGVEIDVGN